MQLILHYIFDYPYSFAHNDEQYIFIYIVPNIRSILLLK